MIVTIDGPAASGKSTVAKEVARRIKANYLDTGVIYRALTLKALQDKIDFNDDLALVKLAQESSVIIETKEDLKLEIYIDGTNVTEKIRAPEVSKEVSRLAKIPGVRKALFKIQRGFLKKRGNLVAEGRDMGTVVFPEADVKIFLQATPRERAKRRSLDLKNAGYSVDLDMLEREIMKRDIIDKSRKAAPMTVAPDAKIIDTTAKTVSEVADEIKKLINGAKRD